jgi:hypothetical protein
MGQMVSADPAERFERQCIVGVCDLRGHPIGAKDHAGRHVLFPKRHRFAKHMYIETFHRSQMRGRRQSIRASAKDGYVTIHRLFVG